MNRNLVSFVCPRCNLGVSYTPKDKDFEHLDISGIAQVAFDHGDHILVVYFDRSYDIRSWQVVDKAVSEEAVVELMDWKRVNESVLVGLNTNFLIADKIKKAYNDTFWEINPNYVLKYIANNDRSTRISVKNKNIWIIPLRRFGYAVTGVDLESIKEAVKLLFILDSFENTLTDLTLLKIVYTTLANAHKTRTLSDNSIRLVREIKSMVDVDVFLLQFALKHAPIILERKNEFLNILNNARFPMRNGGLVDNLFDAGVLFDYIANYHQFRELEIIKIIR